MRKNAIAISQKPNEIIIKVNDNSGQADIIKELEEKVVELRKDV